MANVLNNLVAVVTGGTGDLGQEVVTEFIREGARVVINYRHEDKYKKLKERVSRPDYLAGIPADLMTESSVQDFFQKFQEIHPRLDVFLHLMGGFWAQGEVAETPLEKWQYMMDLNLLSSFLSTREAFKLMKSQCSGKIFTVGSKSALELPAGTGAYAVSKAALIALSEVLAKEGKKYNIQVNCILPGIIDTPANRQAMPDADFNAWVAPRDIAYLLVQLSLPQNRVLSQTALKLYGKL
ncbi:MAG: SDR family NAD(P)-dependent oxidoreductase [Calditrichia bacterium]